jgi:hypothetical protein
MHVYPSAQVAEIFSVSSATIRTWKSRNSAALKEPEHYTKDGSDTLWTLSGIWKLSELMGKTPNLPAVAAEPATPPVAVDALTAPHALDAAKRALDESLLRQVQRILSNPSEAERGIVAQHLDMRLAQIQYMGLAVLFRDGFRELTQGTDKLIQEARNL